MQMVALFAPCWLGFEGEEEHQAVAHGFISYLARDVPSRESLQGRDGCSGDGSRTLLGMVQEGVDGFGEHCIPQGHQVNDHLRLLLGSS